MKAWVSGAWLLPVDGDHHHHHYHIRPQENRKNGKTLKLIMCPPKERLTRRERGMLFFYLLVFTVACCNAPRYPEAFVYICLIQDHRDVSEVASCEVGMGARA